MLVWISETNAATGETTRRQVDMPDVVTPEAQAVTDQQNAATLQTATTNEKTIGDQVDAALTANADYLAITGPTNAQVSAQVKALTRQNNGLIRLLRRKLNGTA